MGVTSVQALLELQGKLAEHEGQLADSNSLVHELEQEALSLSQDKLMLEVSE